jgi:hypothetical protein
VSQSKELVTTTDTLIDFILYGDIHEISQDILGDKAADESKMDTEQLTRSQIAACVKAWSFGKLSKSGHLVE